jgi:RNA polymerase sigma-70 factor (ECF subfamily)
VIPDRHDLEHALSPVDPHDLDRTWAERVRGGDAAAYESIFRALYQPLVAHIVRFVDSRAIAEELVQELFLTLWLRRATLEVRGGSITAYLFSAARNRAIAHLKRERVRARWQDKEEFDARLEQTERVREVRDETVEMEIALAIKAAIDALPERGRQVFRMSRDRGLTYGEIARELGISVKTVENHMGQALRALRERLEGIRK